jgi:hypothetical protein
MSIIKPNLVKPKRRERAASVIAYPANSTTMKWPVGFWWSGPTHSFYFLHEADVMSDLRDRSRYSGSYLMSLGSLLGSWSSKLIEVIRKVSPARPRRVCCWIP